MLLTRLNKNIIRKCSRVYDTHISNKNNNPLRTINDIFQIIPRTNMVIHRRYCNTQTSEVISLPPISDEPLVLFPSLTESLYNSFLMNFVLRLKIDKEFDKLSFLRGAKQAKVTVSHALAKQDYESLSGLVTDNVIESVRSKIMNLTDKQRELIRINEEDVIISYFNRINILFSNDTVEEEKVVEIMVVTQYVQDLQRIIKEEKPLSEQLQEFNKKSLFCNYNFIRKYSKDRTTDWIINTLNHFSASEYNRK